MVPAERLQLARRGRPEPAKIIDELRVARLDQNGARHLQEIGHRFILVELDMELMASDRGPIVRIRERERARTLLAVDRLKDAHRVGRGHVSARRLVRQFPNTILDDAPEKERDVAIWIERLIRALRNRDRRPVAPGDTVATRGRTLDVVHRVVLLGERPFGVLDREGEVNDRGPREHATRTDVPRNDRSVEEQVGEGHGHEREREDEDRDRVTAHKRDGLGGYHGIPARFRAAASSRTWFTTASAAAFSLRRTCWISLERNSRRSCRARAASGMRSACFTR